MDPSANKTIEVVVNGNPRRVPEGLSVVGLLTFLAIDPARVAVELNRTIVRKAEWASVTIGEGANVEVVWFVGGGAGRC
jgi:thiamine biosynthesis protein ThiS